MFGMDLAPVRTNQIGRNFNYAIAIDSPVENVGFVCKVIKCNLPLNNQDSLKSVNIHF